MKRLILLILASLGGCSAEPAAKSIFALGSEDFAAHTRFGLSSSTLTPASIDVSRQALSDDGGISDGGIPDGGAPVPAVWQATGVTAQKGEVLLIEASASVSYDGKSYGPDGDPAIGGTVWALVNRPILALYGRVGSTVFPIGEGTVILAPDSGSLETAINSCAGCTVGGSFAVIVHSELETPLAQEPLLTDNSVESSVTTTVAAGAGFVKSGVTLTKGTKVFIDATGMVTGSGASADANGEGAIGGTSYRLENRHTLRLYGRVGTRVIELGKSAAFLAPADGELELVVNDAPGATGAFQVQVGRGVRPARGMPSGDPSDLANHAQTTLAPDSKWHATTLTARRGDPIAFSATGTLSGSALSEPSVDAYGAGAIGGTSFLIDNAPIWALHGRVGGQIFFVGGSNVLLAPADGTIELAVNGDTSPVNGQLGVSVGKP